MIGRCKHGLRYLPRDYSGPYRIVPSNMCVYCRAPYELTFYSWFLITSVLALLCFCIGFFCALHVYGGVVACVLFGIAFVCVIDAYRRGWLV